MSVLIPDPNEDIPEDPNAEPRDAGYKEDEHDVPRVPESGRPEAEEA